MKKALTLAMLAALFLSANVWAAETKLLSCTLTKLIDSNYFEESLSVDEYPEIEVTRNEPDYVVDIGASQYDQNEGDIINIESAAGADFIVSIRFPAPYKDEIRLVVSGGPQKRTGQIFVKEGRRKIRLIGEMKCK